jgi:2-polyprenyl-3-methyl-5-hydroxy-6-metoxy-1,4-benzoquinol methylase
VELPTSPTDTDTAPEDRLEEAPAPYDFTIDLQSDSTHAKVVRLIGPGKRVLELGPATGYMSRVLQERGCRVVAIELDPAMAARAAAFCERIIVGDLERLDLERELGDDRFDAIVAADVLEHLRDPLAILRRLKPYLCPNGVVVASLPNVAHGSVRLALLGGRFPYGERGLLDRTHLRFYTREGIESLFEEAGLAIGHLERQLLEIDASEIPFDRAEVPPGLLEALSRDPEALTYQFVLTAYPLPAERLAAIQRRLRELRQTVEEQQAHIDALEARGAFLASQKDELRAHLLDAHDQLVRRDEEIVALQAHLREVIAVKDRHIAEQDRHTAELQAALDRILYSAPGRLYRRARAILSLGRR